MQAYVDFFYVVRLTKDEAFSIVREIRALTLVCSDSSFPPYLLMLMKFLEDL